jgi:cytochrome d ubiquinol oxidase subunit I
VAHRKTYRRASDFWLKIFVVNFVVGAASGIVIEFQFGTNWASYRASSATSRRAAASRGAGVLPRIGLPGLLLFGRKKISSFVPLSVTMVWFG